MTQIVRPEARDALTHGPVVDVASARQFRRSARGGAYGLLVRRFALAILTLLAVSVLLFVFVEVLPGDAASRSAGDFADPTQVAVLRQQYGLDRPVAVQYLSWLWHAARGDLGNSLVSGAEVTSIISARIWNTALLAGVSIFLVSVVALGVGLWAGSHPAGRRNAFFNAVTTVVVAVPEFVTATILLTVFSVWTQWLPPLVVVAPGESLLSHPSMLVLPFASVVILTACAASRLVRAVVIDCCALPHVEAARLQGIGEWTVLRRHLLPSVVGPSAQIIAFLVPYLVGGTLVVEIIFNYPGMSHELLDAVSNRDAPVVLGIGMLYATVTVLSFLAADVIGIATNPRLKGRVG